MSAPSDIVSGLEQALTEGTPETRSAALWYATDMLMIGRYSEEQIWLFGEIIDRLAVELETQARAKLSNLLCHANNAPFQTVRKLAHDDAIVVAGPVLRHSTRLSESDLVEAARSKSQQHLMAIAERKSLTEAVTDVLVTRGDPKVAQTVARNEGARFSDRGFWNLIKRSENDSILAECVGVRKDIPRPLFLQLISKASDVAQQRLMSAAPAARDQIQHVVAEATSAVRARFGPGSREYYIAKRLVTEMHQGGELDENELYGFVKAKKFEETTVAFTLLCGVPPDVAERALIDDTPDMLLILGKSAGFSWKTVQALLIMRTGDKGIAKDDMDDAYGKFCRLTTTSAKQVLNFYEARRKSKAS